MQKTSFASLPGLVQLTSLGTLFIGWVLIAEFIIDRHGYDRFLPFYRVGNLCPYDLAVVVALAATWILMRRG
ncbi:MAG: hypothetical protein ABL996_17035 [Micropepsaceae bacterium]